MNTTKTVCYISTICIFMCVASLAHGKDYEVSGGSGGNKTKISKHDETYESVYDIIADTFLTSIALPDAAQLLDAATIALTNQTILDFITKKNKSLGFKNSDIDNIASEQSLLIGNELVNTIKEYKGIQHQGTVFDKNRLKIIATFNKLHEKCIAIARQITKVRSKRFPPITDTSKKLLDLSLNLN